MLHHALMAVLSCWFIILRVRARVDCLSTIYYKQSYCSVEKNCKVLVFFFQNNSVNSFFFFSMALVAVYTSNWYMEYRLHFCWSDNRETSFSWQKCCSPVGLNDWSTWYAVIRYNLTGECKVVINFVFFSWRGLAQPTLKTLPRNRSPARKKNREMHAHKH